MNLQMSIWPAPKRKKNKVCTFLISAYLFHFSFLLNYIHTQQYTTSSALKKITVKYRVGLFTFRQVSTYLPGTHFRNQISFRTPPSSPLNSDPHALLIEYEQKNVGLKIFHVSKLQDYLNCNMLQIIFEFSVVISKTKIGTR